MRLYRDVQSHIWEVGHEVSPENTGVFLDVLLGGVLFHWLIIWIGVGLAKLFPSRGKLSQLKWQREVGLRLPSTVHAIIISYACAKVYLGGMPSGSESSDQVLQFFISGSLGYFLQDTLMMLLWRKDIQMIGVNLAHHIILFVCCTGAMETQRFLWAGMLAFMMESSTPFINVRFWLMQRGQEFHPMYPINAAISTLLFFVFRALLSPYLFVQLLVSSYSSKNTGTAITIFSAFMAATLWFLNWMWFWGIIAIVIKWSEKAAEVKSKK